MARNIDPKCRLCRRANEKLFLKGDRCLTPKCAMMRRAYAPGAHGKNATRNVSQFGQQLAMKQRIKRIYGVLEKQFRKHFEDVAKRKGVIGDLLLERLELRLDNVVYRMGFATSRSLARQLVNHGLFSVNGQSVDIPSYEVREGDVIAVLEHKSDKNYFKNRSDAFTKKKDYPKWVEVDAAKLKGTVIAKPKRSDIDAQVESQAVVEFYSK